MKASVLYALLVQQAQQWQNNVIQQSVDYANTVHKTDVSTFVPVDQSAIWGQHIPRTWGHVILDAPIMQLGALEGQSGERYNSWAYSDGNGTTAWGDSINYRWVMDIVCALGYNGDTTRNRIIRRIWIDGILAYDESANTLNMLKFAFIPQSELTTPHPSFYTSFDNPLAYRGLQHLILLDFVVNDFKLGIRRTALPKVRVEFYDYTIPANPSTVYDPIDGSWSGSINGDSTVYDSRAQLIYSLDTSNVWHVFNPKTQEEVTRYDFTDPSNLFIAPINFGESDDGCLVRGWQTDQVFLTFETGLDNGVEIGICDLLTGEVIDHFGAPAIFPTNSYTGNRIRSNLFHYPFYSGAPGFFRSYVLIVTQTSGWFIWNICDEKLGIAGEFTFVSLGEIATNPILHISQDGVYSDVGGTRHLVVYGGGSTNQYGFLDIDPEGRFSYGSMGTPANEASTTWGATFTSADRCFIVFETVSGTRKIKKFRSSDGALVGTITTGFNWPTPNQLWQQSETNGRGLAWLVNTGGDRVVYRLDFLNFSITSYSVGAYSFSEQLLYDAMSNKFFQPNSSQGLNELDVAPVTAGSVPLSSVLTGICVAKGYDSADVTVTGINDTVIGAILPDRFDLDQVLGDLAKVYNFSYINREGKIIITRATTGLGFSATWDVYEVDRIPYDEDELTNGITIKSRRLTDSKVPSKTELTFIDYNYNYNASTYTYQRPEGTNQSNTSQAFTIPIVMDMDTAAALVTRMTYDAWASRTEHEFKVGKKFLAMEPGDTVNLHRSGYIDVVKVLEVTIGVNYEIEVKSEGINTISGPVLETDPYTDLLEPYRAGDGLTDLLVIDTPALDVNDQQGDEVSPLYFATIPAGRGSFTGASIFRTDSLTTPYFKFLESQVEPLWGRMTETLTDEYWLGIDRLYPLELQVYGGDKSLLTTVTTEEMLGGANRLLVGNTGRWELIGFESVTITNGRYIINGILRGLRGTDIYIGTHQASDKWIFVDDNVLLDQERNEAIGDTFYFKAAGRQVPLALAIRRSMSFAANGRKPLAVINATVEDDGTGELTISATRRNRTEETIVNSVASPSTLDEDLEEYELEIYDGSTLVRTVTGLTTPEYVYTTANQTTDGFTPPLLSLRIKWYQISAAVGRGFARDVTEDVKQP